MERRNLIAAARTGDLDELRRLIERDRMDPDNDDEDEVNWFTPLHNACITGQFDVVQYLVEEARADLAVLSAGGWTALHAASRYGKTTIAKYLVETAGLNVNAKTELGDTPLHYACYYGHVGIIRYLASQKQARLDMKNLEGLTATYDAFQSSRRAEVVPYIIERVPCVDDVVVRLTWQFDFPWETKKNVLEKYAMRQQMVAACNKNPIHTVLRFPLPSKDAFQECINCFPVSTLSLCDRRGRLPIHVAFTSSDASVKSPSLVSLLAKRELRLAFARDPTSGLYPFETAALLLSIEEGRGWLDVVYEMFRADPFPLLRSRGLSCSW